MSVTLWSARKCDQLRQHPMFWGIEETVLVALLQALSIKWVRVKAGEPLWLAGHQNPGLWLLLSGQIRLEPAYHPSELGFQPGDQARLCLRKAGDVMGWDQLNRPEQPATQTAWAHQTTEAIFIPIQVFHDPHGLLDPGVTPKGAQQLLINFLHFQQKQIQALGRRLALLTYKNLPGKLAAFALQQREVVQPNDPKQAVVPERSTEAPRSNESLSVQSEGAAFDPVRFTWGMNQQALSEFLQSARPAISRELARWETNRWVSLDRKGGWILDEAALVALAKNRQRVVN